MNCTVIECTVQCQCVLYSVFVLYSVCVMYSDRVYCTVTQTWKKSGSWDPAQDPFFFLCTAQCIFVQYKMECTLQWRSLLVLYSAGVCCTVTGCVVQSWSVLYSDRVYCTVLACTVQCTVIGTLQWNCVTMGHCGCNDNVTMRAPEFIIEWALGRFILSALSLCLYVCVAVIIQKTHFPVSWRPQYC